MDCMQYLATAFEEFSKEYGFTHVTSSLKYPQTNGASEWVVKIKKKNQESRTFHSKNQDPHLAMLTYTAGE